MYLYLNLYLYLVVCVSFAHAACNLSDQKAATCAANWTRLLMLLLLLLLRLLLLFVLHLFLLPFYESWNLEMQLLQLQVGDPQ